MSLNTNERHPTAQKRCFSAYTNRKEQGKPLTINHLYIKRISDRCVIREKYERHERGKTARLSAFNTCGMPSHTYGRFYKLALTDCETIFEVNLFVGEGVWRAIRLDEQAN